MERSTYKIDKYYLTKVDADKKSIYCHHDLMGELLVPTHKHDKAQMLYAEGDERPSMLSIGMHCRILGRPGRMRALQRFLDHLEKHERVWVTRRIDIARHWKKAHPFNPETAFVWPAQ